jgi:hypothetical protein
MDGCPLTVLSTCPHVGTYHILVSDSIVHKLLYPYIYTLSVRGTPFDLLSSLYPYIYSFLSLHLPYSSFVVEVASVVTVTVIVTVM